VLRQVAFAVALLAPTAAFAQVEPGPPGPYIIDLRGTMVGVPSAGEFYPTLPPTTTVPGRAFGFDVGGHVLGPRLGGSRIGIGANALFVRGQVGPPDVSVRLTAMAPQVSFSFGSADGWSYLSGGYGMGRVSTRVSVSGSPDAELGTGMVGTLNFGGGARWFVKPRMAAGFDVRFLRFGASGDDGTPATMRVALSVGVSLR
jgi:hypothetical protein